MSRQGINYLMKFTVYILSSADGGFHFGITKNLEERLNYHHSGKHAVTQYKLPVELIFEKQFSDLRLAQDFHSVLATKNDLEIRQIISGELEIKVSDRKPARQRETNKSVILLPAVYLPNISYLSALTEHTDLVLDVEELFQKQTYRSRCTILGANGIQNLVVPVERPYGKNTKMKDVRVSYAENWQKDHIRAIESAYRRAPYFEYYAGDLFAIYSQPYDYLIDLNIAFTEFLIQAFKLDLVVYKGTSEDLADKEGKIMVTPKNRLNYACKAYQQVFSHGEFEPNLSALDLLFNQGSLT